MLVKEAVKGEFAKGNHAYRIGFINNDGNEDETELDATSVKGLEEVWVGFCNENKVKTDAIVYIERVLEGGGE